MGGPQRYLLYRRRDDNQRCEAGRPTARIATWGDASAAGGSPQFDQALREQRSLDPHRDRFRYLRNCLAVPLGRRAITPLAPTLAVAALPAAIRPHIA